LLSLILKQALIVVILVGR